MQGSPEKRELVALISQDVFPRHNEEATLVEVPALQNPAEYEEQTGAAHEGVP